MPPAWPEQRGALFTRHWVGVVHLSLTETDGLRG